MKRLFLALTALTLSVMASLQAQNLELNLPGLKAEEKAKVTAELISEVTTAVAGQPFKVAVKLVHAPEHHTYGKTIPEGVIGKPTALKWTLPEGWQIKELPWPATHSLISTDGAKSDGYDGTVYLPAEVTPNSNASGSATLAVLVDALVCDPQSCMPIRPEASLTLQLGAQTVANPNATEAFARTAAPTAPETAPSSTQAQPASSGASASATPSGSFAGYLLFAFIGGLILNIMPCVFPVLGIKIMGVVQQAGGDKKQVVLHGFAYTAGVLVSFLALGALVISLGKSWGFQLQSPPFVFGLAAFFLIFALNMAGVFEIGASAVGVGAELQAKHGFGGSFFSGLLATVVATPCSAPFLGTALGVTLTLPPAQAMLIFTFIGLGLASPFLLLSFVPNLVAALPRPGAWMESFKQGMSFLLFGTVAFLLWVLTGMVEGQPLLFLLFGLVLIAMGGWVYGRWSLPHKPARTRMLAVIIALLFIGGGLAAGWPEKTTATSHSAVTEGGLEWGVWSEAKVAELQKAGTPVYIDFTAKWCFTCQVNKRVYKDASLQALFAQHKVALLKADWTNEDPTIKDALNKLGKAAVPVNVLYIPGQKEPHILPEILTVENVTEALKQIEGHKS